MNSVFDGVLAVASWVGRTSLQASVLIALLLVGLALVRGRVPARWRYALWLVVLVRLLLPWAPESPLSLYGILPSGQKTPAQAPGMATHDSIDLASPSRRAPASQGVAQSPRPLEERKGGREFEEMLSETARAEAVSPESSSAVSTGARTKPAASILTLPVVLGAVWFLGVLVLGGFVAHQGLLPALAVGRRRYLTDQATLDLLEDCKETLDAHTFLGIVETPLVRSPALFGFVRPLLLFPPGAVKDLGPGRLRHIFLHELAHLKRHDIALNWVMSVLQILHWFNPMVWYAFRQIRLEREMACDALVLERTGARDAADYGKTLVHLVESYSRPRALPNLAGIAEDQSLVGRRIAMISNWKTRSRAGSLVGAALLVLLAGVGLTDAAKPSAEDAAASQKPDPAVIDLTLQPYTEEEGLYTVVASVRNQGKTVCPKMDARFFKQDPGSEAKSLIGGAVHGVGPLEPDQQWNEMCSPFRLKEGDTRITFTLDPDNVVNETDEGNNGASLRATFKDGRVVERLVSFCDETAEPEKPAVDSASLEELAGGKILRSEPITKDCMVLAYLPEWRYGNVDNIAVANNDGGVRTLVAWPEVSPEEAKQPSGRFYLALYSRETTAHEPYGTIEAHELLNDWSETTAWNDQPSAEQQPASLHEFTPTQGWKLFDITSIVRAHAEQGTQPNGVLLRFQDETASGNARTWSGYAFVSRHAAGQWADKLPRLLIVESDDNVGPSASSVLSTRRASTSSDLSGRSGIE